MAALTHLSNGDLRETLHDLAASDREIEVELAWHLLELERRRLVLEWGYNSLWDFARREMKWSESTACRRVAVSRLVGRLPDVASYLRDGRISICVLAVLAPHLKEAGLSAVLDRASGMSRREAEGLAVELGGKPVAARKDVIRIVAVAVRSPQSAAWPAASSPPFAAQPAADVSVAPALPSAALPSPAMPSPAMPSPTIPPPAASRTHRVGFDANDGFVENVRRLREILGNAALNDLMLRASEALLDQVDPIRRHLRREKRKNRQCRGSKQTITSVKLKPKVLKHRQPIAVRDEVASRDGAQCSYVSRDGVRCSGRTWLHIDHIRPFALGGSSTDVHNNRVLCAAHNLGREAKSAQGVRDTSRSLSNRPSRTH